MGWSYRKRIKLGPVNINFSFGKKGPRVGFSVGKNGQRITKRADGRVTMTNSIPGTGIRRTKTLSKK